MTQPSPFDLYRIALGDSRPPYSWQQQFATRNWPKVLIAPTGSGKTAGVTLGWVAQRLRAPDSTPRRLVWCFPMRVLAEQTAEAVKTWVQRLKGIDPLQRLPTPEDIHVLMGGAEAGRWLDHPERPSVLVGTQDMLLSRALMRGYASSRALWPIEFAFLHEDAQWVFDEVQLMGAGRATAAQLEGFRRRETARLQRNHRPARSLWMSATLDPDWLGTVDHPVPPPESVMRVEPGEQPADRLGRLVQAVKHVRRSGVRPESDRAGDIKGYVDQLAEQVLGAHRPAGMTLIIVNRVSRAQLLYGALKKLLSAQGSLGAELSLIHSRFRAGDRRREMERVLDRDRRDQIVVATQAVEAGVDLSAAVMFTELAPWSSLVQRFGRANRYAELPAGADIHWIDLLPEDVDGKDAAQLALPYSATSLSVARDRLTLLQDAAPANLGPPGEIDAPARILRRKDLSDLFDTDPDLTGFDVDVSPYIRDADDTDIRVFWRGLSEPEADPPFPRRDELCAVPIRDARAWSTKVRRSGSTPAKLYVRDPQWRHIEGRSKDSPAGWRPLREEPWPGLTLLATLEAGGYSEELGFTGELKHRPAQVLAPTDETRTVEADGHDGDPLSGIGRPTSLPAHLRHAATEARAICGALGLDQPSLDAVVRSCAWHDVGKAHPVFQRTMRSGLDGHEAPADELLAKTVRRLRHDRAFFRHELASALAFLSHESWRRGADLVSYLIAAHHGKVRMNLRALPREKPPGGEYRGGRFARGVWEGEELPRVDVGAGEIWEGGRMSLAIMELGRDDETGESWTERTRALLAREGPFRLAWLESLVRIADWRASGKEAKGQYPDG